MAKRNFSCREVSIDHEQLVQLREDGHLNLGIDDLVATQISELGYLKSKRVAVAGAYHFWNAVGLGVLGYSVYLSLTDNWWWFIPGVFLAGIVWRANRKSNSENVMRAAFVDAEFYEKVRDLGGWIYQLEESEVQKYWRT